MFDLKKSSRQRCDGLDPKHGKKMCSFADGGGARTHNLQHYALLRTQFTPPMCKTRYAFTGQRDCLTNKPSNTININFKNYYHEKVSIPGLGVVAGRELRTKSEHEKRTGERAPMGCGCP